MQTLCVIPARGGSKGVPGKNLATVGGRPLIDWTIRAAREARHIDRVVVSTDAEEIAAAARAAGAEVPFLRPAELARDDTPGIEPVLHAVRALESDEYRPDVIVCLQPTSPLRNAQDVDVALGLFAPGVDAVVAVTPVRHHPAWMKTVDEEGMLAPMFPDMDVPATRQGLAPVFALNGAIYAARRDVLVETRSWYTERTRAYVMPAERSLDIDTPWDLRVADLLLGEAKR